MSGKFNNIQKMIKLLRSHSHGITLEQMKHHLKVNVRTVKRYLTQLRDSGYNIIDIIFGKTANIYLVLFVKFKKVPS